MKIPATLIMIFLFINPALKAQSPCLPQGITFSEQQQVDSFQVNFPGCSEIEGDVMVSGSNISNLNGLTVLNAIDGDLFINTDSLANLVGLNNLQSIGGDFGVILNASLSNFTGIENLSMIGGSLLILKNNTSFSSLNGLEGLVSIGGDLQIKSCYSLFNLNGLNNLESIGGSLIIQDNDALFNMQGLEGLESVGGNLSIGGANEASGNSNLINLEGLNNLGSIGGSVKISYNYFLENLNGLNNLDINSINDLEIIYNYSLSECAVQGICNYLANPNGTVTIHDNFFGCNNPWEIADACGFVLSCLPEGNYYFTHQSDIDNFLNFMNCSELAGYFLIKGFSISSLSGLNQVSSIFGDLNINETDELSDLSGLDNLSLVTGDIRIVNNSNLMSLSGIDSISSGSVQNILITQNELLESCSVQSICNVIASPTGVVVINLNGPGCNSVAEVEEGCDTTVLISDLKINDLFIVSPSPCSGITHLKYYIKAKGWVIGELFDMSGARVRQLVNEQQSVGSHEKAIDLSNLQQGVYFCKLKTNEGVQTKKIIKL